jgi:acrylyl-CoA reductase (NADPH)
MRFRALRSFDEAGQRVSRRVELDIDDLDAGDLLLKSRFAAVNYKDARAVSGQGKVLTRYPCVPGIEVSGMVVESADRRFKSGDLVTVQGGREFGMSRDGAFAEYVRVPAAWAHSIPAGFDAFSVVALGVGGYTSAMAIERIEQHGVNPDDGEIIVTGATGGCGGFAVNMLAGLGYTVVGMTGKAGEHDYLKRIGAARVVGRELGEAYPKPLDTQLWAACIDTVGGAPLDGVLRTMRAGGIVAAFGNAGGENLATSIYPFILRSVTLAGINANHPIDRRTTAWTRMSTDLRPQALEAICHRVPFADLLDYCDTVIAGRARGRGVVVF